MNNTKFAALYCRLSKSEEANIDSNSIANQKAALIRASQMYGYEHMQFFIDGADIIGLNQKTLI